jgi:FKBP-type peptidyl-prolyl cis-trans isomerase FklB
MRCVWISLALALAATSASAQTAEQNLTAGKKFMAQVAKAPGMARLPSGVMYRIVSRAPNPGAQPTLNDTVKIDYEGKLITGQVFDSSYARHEPADLPLGQLVPAWQEVIPLMHVGDEVILYTPPSEAYGDRDMSPDIPPDSTLIFRVHLIGIEGAQ